MPFDPNDPASLDGLDLSSLLGTAPQQQAPSQPALPQGPKPQSAWAQAALAALIPIAAKKGGRVGVAALLNGMQQEQARREQEARVQGQTQFENQRQLQGDQRLQQQDAATDQYRRASLMSTAGNQQDQRRATLMKEAASAIQQADSPETVKALLDFYNPQLAQAGIRNRGALDSLALQVATPSAMEQKAATKYIGQLEKTYGQDWAQKVGTATFVLPGAPADPTTGKPKALTVQELLAKSGLNMQGLPAKPPNQNQVNAGSFEDYVIRYAKDHKTTPDALTTKDIQQARKEYGQADDRGLAPPITINLPGMSPEEKVVTAAQAIREGRMAPSQLTTFFAGMGQNSEAKLRDAVMAQILRDDPKFNFAGAESNYQFGKSNGTQTTVRYIDNIAKTIPMLRDANQTFKRSNIQIVNGLIQSSQAQIGNVNVADFNFKLTLLADEIAKVLQGGGTGSATSDAKLKQAQALLSGRMSAPQLETVLDAAQDMLKVRRETLSQGTFMQQPQGAVEEWIRDANGKLVKKGAK